MAKKLRPIQSSLWINLKDTLKKTVETELLINFSAQTERSFFDVPQNLTD